MPQLDSTDRRILLDLDSDFRRPFALIARRLNLARNTVHARLENMISHGHLGAHSTRIDPASLGYPVRAIIMASVDQGEVQVVLPELEAISEIVECLALTGQDDVMFRVVARDITHLYEVGQRILHIDGIGRTSTSVVLNEYMPHRVAQLLTVDGSAQ